MSVHIKSKIELFWEWFAVHQKAFVELKESTRDAYFADLYQRLQLIDEHLSFEFSAELIEGRRTFMITANGHYESFPTVLDLVEQAPKLEGLRILPFRPHGPLGNLEMQTITVLRDDVFFDYEKTEHGFDLLVFIRNFNEENQEYVKAGFLFVERALGEFLFGTKIANLAFYDLDDEVEMKPITDLFAVVMADEQQA